MVSASAMLLRTHATFGIILPVALVLIIGILILDRLPRFG
jgi:hypothetical protein